MQRGIIAFAICAAGILSAAPYAAAGCALAESKAVSEDTVINDTCPVMGGEVSKDTPYRYTYKGETIGFCCGNCINTFKANPEKYMAELKKEKAEKK